MADIADTLKNLLGDNADEKISSVMNMLSENAALKNDGNDESSGEGNIISQARGLMSQLSNVSGDDRSNLLMSLKPFMRQGRKDSIDKAVKMLNFAQLSQLLGEGF